MPKKPCRYNNKHKFDSEEELLSHEKYCPDKSKRTDLKECPYSNKHIVLTKQYEKHIKTCKYRPKNNSKKEEQKIEEIKSNDNNNGNEINKYADWDLEVEQWINEETLNNDKINEKNKIIIKKLKAPSNQNVFVEEDFIYKECYI